MGAQRNLIETMDYTPRVSATTKLFSSSSSPADWRPGRTVVLCSWDAEEYGLIGSTEWVEVGKGWGGECSNCMFMFP